MMELAASMSNVIALGRGDPDLDTPPVAWQEALKRMNDNSEANAGAGAPSLA